MPKRLVSLLSVFLVFGPAARGTAISFLVDVNAIYLASDSRATENVKSGKPIGGTVCKIRVIRNWIFVSSGLAMNIATKFNIWEVASSTLGSETTAQGGMEALKRSLLKSLPAAVKETRTSTPNASARWVGRETPVLAVALGSIELGVAKLLECEFFLNKSGGIDAPRCDLIQGTSSGPGGWNMGSNEATMAYLKTHAAGIDHTERSQLAFVKKSIELEIEADRQTGEDEVGPPIAVGKLDATGFHLVQPGACSALDSKK